MKILLIYILIICIIFQFKLTTSKFEGARQPKVFKVDLDLHPRERWKSVLINYKDDVIPRIAEMARSYVPTNLRSPIFGFFC